MFKNGPGCCCDFSGGPYNFWKANVGGTGVTGRLLTVSQVMQIGFSDPPPLLYIDPSDVAWNAAEQRGAFASQVPNTDVEVAHIYRQHNNDTPNPINPNAQRYLDSTHDMSTLDWAFGDDPDPLEVLLENLDVQTLQIFDRKEDPVPIKGTPYHMTYDEVKRQVFNMARDY